MNYIKKLEAENKALAGKLAEISLDLNSFLRHLQSEKFTGQSFDGHRKDWISTGDVLAVCVALRSKI